METTSHQQLKRLALAFLLREGCRAVGVEVRCPIGKYRVDAAGYQPRNRQAKRDARTVFIECKESRADFLRDTQRSEDLLIERMHLEHYRQEIEEHRIKVEEPELRESGTSLFTELETWNFQASKLPTYRRLLKRLRQVDRALHGDTKFHTAVRYRLADALYLAAPRGMIRHHEVPPGWGLIEFPRRLLEAREIKARLVREMEGVVSVEAPSMRSPEKHQHRMLMNIAASATRAGLLAHGISHVEDDPIAEDEDAALPDYDPLAVTIRRWGSPG